MQIFKIEKYETKELIGRVIDEQGKPVPGAKIELTKYLLISFSTTN